MDTEQFPTRLQGDGVVHGSIRDDPSSDLTILRNALKAWHWTGYKRVFELAAVICATDRQYEKVHKAIMDIGAEQERAMSVIVARLLAKDKDATKEEVKT